MMAFIMYLNIMHKTKFTGSSSNKYAPSTKTIVSMISAITTENVLLKIILLLTRFMAAYSLLLAKTLNNRETIVDI